MIIRCTCVHSEQDRLHGFGHRVANLIKAVDKVRCTVCKTEVNINSPMQTVATTKKKKK
jgi:hypothetical protein